MMKERKSKKQRFFSVVLAVIMLLSVVALPASANTPEPVHNDETVWIVDKSAKWTDTENYLAELTIAVNGTEVRAPLDVIIVLDRSGSMDMEFIHPTYGDHSSSCPCLNQEHFYLKPVAFIPQDNSAGDYENAVYYAKNDTTVKYSAKELYETYTNEETIFYIDGLANAIVVYNQELVRNDGAIYGKWVVLETAADAADNIHLYYEFPIHNAGGTIDGRDGLYQDAYDLAPYHFTMENGEYVRISKWETSDVRKTGASAATIAKGETGKPYSENTGIWNHADSSADCYDRWTEAKDAITAFSNEMLSGQYGDNRIALVPFSLRDEGLLNMDQANPSANRGYLNTDTSRYYKRWLLEQGYLANFGVHAEDWSGTVSNKLIEIENYLTGAINTKVNLTNDASDITGMLPKIFTTVNTDYIYGLSMAYNMIASRPEAEQDRAAVVVFLSDGTPYDQKASLAYSNNIHSFFNPDSSIKWLSDAIKSTDEYYYGEKDPNNTQYATNPKTDFWPGYAYHKVDAKTITHRHDVKPEFLKYDDETKTYIGAKGLGASIVTVGYMIEDTEQNVKRLTDMASDPSLYIELKAEASATTAGVLAQKLLETTLYPGGRNSILTDEISKYFYVPEDWADKIVYSDSASGSTVTIEPASGADAGNQTLVWNIGNIFSYAEGKEPRITIPLVLREEYRSVSSTTYYPTNADDAEPPLDIPGGHDPDAEHGAEITYTDPENVPSYDTIETPKLPVYPPTTPDPEEPKKPEPIEVPLPGVSKTVTYDTAPETDATFTMVLTGKNGAPMPSTSSVTVSGGQSASFGSVAISEAGVYEYSIYEIDGALSGYTYDKAVYSVVITVTEKDGKLEYTSSMTKSNDPLWSGSTAAFTNEYKADEPPIEEQTLALELRKVLKDEDGNPIGDGKLFTVQVLDNETGGVIATVKLPANGASVFVYGLQPDRAYSVSEMEGEHFAVDGFDIEGFGTVSRQYFIFKSTATSEESYGIIRITVNNTCKAEDEEKILDPEDPSFPEIPEDEEIITIDPEDVPLAPGVPEPEENVDVIIDEPDTGDYSPVWQLVVIMVAASCALFAIIKPRKKSKN